MVFLEVVTTILAAVLVRLSYTIITAPRKKFHIKYTLPINDMWLTWLMARLIPAFLQKKLFIRKNAPSSRPRDIFETAQEDPYAITELEKGKVWMVKYAVGASAPTQIRADATTRKMLVEALELSGDSAAKEQSEKDWQRLVDFNKIDEKAGAEGEWNRFANQLQLHMTVVRLNSGDILIYSAKVIHDGTKLQKWLDALGTVKYIVIGSCYHTNYLPETCKRYPDAVYIGPRMAEWKLQFLGCLRKGKLDYCYMDEDELREVNGILNPEGVGIYFTEGDIGTQTSFVVAHNTAIEQDLVYLHHDNCSCDFCANPPTGEKWFLYRLFKWILLSKPHSPNGHTAVYRFAMMDPTSPMACFSCPRPAPDGSSCNVMAASLRKILALESYSQVITGHFGLMGADDFKRNVDVAWNWLDEASLLTRE